MTNGDLSTISDMYGGVSYCDQLEGVEPSAPSQPVYGRDDEMSALKKAYERLLETKKVQTVIVRGVSGSGKTALIDTLRDPVIDTHGYFVAGKYFQNTDVQEPYSAIMAAFSDLCDLLVQSNDFDTERRQEIADALKPYAPILLKAITSISSLIGFDVDPFVTETSSFAKFKVACNIFLDTVASDEHPIVIFLDDIQWADDGSNELIQMLLRESGAFKNVMFILAHRTEALEQVATVLENVPNPTEITLSNLNTATVHHMVASMLGTDSDQIRQMSTLVASRTSGNPMHVVMFMEMIQNEGLLVYNEETNSWQFDVANIQEEMMVSDTLADLLIRKIERLSSGDAIKQILKVASLMGYSFNESVLLQVIDALIEDENESPLKNDCSSFSASIGSHATLYDLLLGATNQGFIEKVRVGYQFSHDKLQSAFKSFIAETEEAYLHELIGRAFLAQRENEESYVYMAAVHLNQVPDFLSKKENRGRLARINLEAAKYCKEKCAFNKAAMALQQSLECLGAVDERWNIGHSSMTFEIMEALARIQLIIGECEACKATIRETLCRYNISAELNISLQLIDVEARVIGNEVDGALSAANRALVATLGIKMPRKVSIRHVAGKLIKVRWMLRGETNESILNLPPTQNIFTANAVKLLMHICSFCLLKNEPETGLFFALLATEVTLKHGLSQYSSSAFAFYGVAEAALGKTDRAYRFGKVALAIIDKIDCKEAECQTVGFTLPMLEFYRKPMCTLVDRLYNAALSGLQSGDIAFATSCLSHYFGMHLILATNLSSLEEIMRSVYDRVRDLGQESLTLLLTPSIQYVLNMQSDATSWETISLLSGEIMNEDYYFEEARGKNNMLVLLGMMLKANLAAIFNQFSIAASIFEDSESYGADTIRLTYASSNVYCTQSRVYFELFERTGKRHHLRKARKFKKRLHGLVLDGNPNATGMYTYLITIESILKKRFMDDLELRHAYSSGMNSIERTGCRRITAFFSEKAGLILAKRGLVAEAGQYFDRALHIYEHEWGARAKYNQLKQQIASALPHVAMKTPHGAYIDVKRLVKMGT